ncbi:ABC transporter substrate-binding protein [Microvirga antarctica]|uniref:ABC transporter substrate-binding protein n=1 Tax=Microvirga antarctica TaxID=2819233 RepID=UPI001B31492B|nr:ABC transporter substrate-binding protein [Microvirga antarctica]
MRFSLRCQLAAAAVLLALSVPALAAEKLVVGAYPSNPPWEAKNEKGEFEGFEVDLAKAIGEKLGRPVEFQDLGFQALFAATSSGRIDMAISSISITNERLKSQSFTQGYYDSDLALVSAAGSKLKSIDEVKGQSLGAISSSVGEAWIKENTAKYGIGAYKGYNTQQDLMLDTRNERVAGAIGDIAGFQFAFLKMPGMKVVARIPTGDQFAIMMRKGSPLLEPVNEAISALKKDGTMAKLHKKWLGTDPEAGASVVTVKPVPSAP